MIYGMYCYLTAYLFPTKQNLLHSSVRPIYAHTIAKVELYSTLQIDLQGTVEQHLRLIRSIMPWTST